MFILAFAEGIKSLTYIYFPNYQTFV